MTDLFAQPVRSVGYGNAMFLCDLAMNVPDATMRERYKRGEYPDIHTPSISGWRRLNGRR